SYLGKLYAYDPKINRTFHRLIRSSKSSKVTNSSLNNSVFASDSPNSVDFDYDIANSNSHFGIFISKFILDNMTDNNRTLKELATSDVMCEDPHKHLKEFHVVCSTMRSYGILKDYIKMKAFPFSLDGAIKD
ncbi:hypothetical protein CR513_47106, partial [Mucuna pruriens]